MLILERQHVVVGAVVAIGLFLLAVKYLQHSAAKRSLAWNWESVRTSIRSVTGKQWVVVGMSFAVALLWLGLETWNRSKQNLYERARSFDTEESRRAVDEMSKHKGAETTQLLFRLARDRNNLNAGYAAVALAKREDGDVPEMLTSFLQPHESLNLRKIAAKGLIGRPCGFDCIRAVLQYRERIQSGSPVSESRWVTDAPWNREIDAELAKERELVNEGLDRVLKENSSTTSAVLREVYGVGSDTPDPFGLGIEEKLRLEYSCQDLRSLDRRLHPHPDEAKVMPKLAALRLRLRDIAVHNGCPSE